VAHLGFAARRQPTLSAVRPFAEVAPLLVLSYGDLVSAGEPRLLARASERGYTSALQLAMHGEPEAISNEEQQRQTLAARRRWQAKQRRAWGTARQHIFDAVEGFRRDGHPDGQLLNDVKAIERQVGRVDKHLDELGKLY
jgi:hypothetical protein